jgi:hypothetical protein
MIWVGTSKTSGGIIINLPVIFLSDCCSRRKKPSRKSETKSVPNPPLADALLWRIFVTYLLFHRKYFLQECSKVKKYLEAA